MRRLTRRLALPIFGVLWITVLLFFWVTKRKLEVPLGPEVQTPKVCRLARAGLGALAGGRARGLCAGFEGSKAWRGVSGCRE